MEDGDDVSLVIDEEVDLFPEDGGSSDDDEVMNCNDQYVSSGDGVDGTDEVDLMPHLDLDCSLGDVHSPEPEPTVNPEKCVSQPKITAHLRLREIEKRKAIIEETSFACKRKRCQLKSR